MVMTEVSVVIPTHPQRIKNGMLTRALRSVVAQTYMPDVWHVVNDVARRGATATRNQGLMQVETDWVAFLDSDDEWLPNHLATLVSHVDDDVDVLYSGCTVLDGTGHEVPRQEAWGRFGQAFNADLLRKASYIPVTSMVRTTLAQRVGGFSYPSGSSYEDWGFYLKLLDAGARFMHIPEVTWIWHHHGNNTSGRPDRGDAR